MSKLKQVRKEKLGDRIAALQQLVAPFGKVRTTYLLTIVFIIFQSLQIKHTTRPQKKEEEKKND